MEGSYRGAGGGGGEGGRTRGHQGPRGQQLGEQEGGPESTWGGKIVRTPAEGGFSDSGVPIRRLRREDTREQGDPQIPGLRKGRH